MRVQKKKDFPWGSLSSANFNVAQTGGFSGRALALCKRPAVYALGWAKAFACCRPSAWP